MFQIPNAGSVYLYQKQINMRWGEKKLTQLCRDEMGIDRVVAKPLPPGPTPQAICGCSAAKATT